MTKTPSRRLYFLIIFITLGLAAVTSTGSSAFATEGARQTRPVVAGSQLEFEFGGDCTAGAVVQKIAGVQFSLQKSAPPGTW